MLREIRILSTDVVSSEEAYRAQITVSIAPGQVPPLLPHFMDLHRHIRLRIPRRQGVHVS